MSNLQDRRERISRGDTVYVLVNPGGGAPMKRKPARVISVMRAGAEVMVEGESKARTVRLNALEIPTPLPPARPEPGSAYPEARAPGRPLGPSSPAPGPDTARSPGRPQGGEPAIPAYGTAAFSGPPGGDTTASDVEAWLALGESMAAPLRGKIEALREEALALDDEAKAIALRRSEIDVEVRRCNRMLSRIAAIERDDDGGGR